MRTPSQDVQRRRPVWEALSDLFLDTELEEDALRHIAHVLVESAYTDDEVERILFTEIYPVCIWNMRCVAGEWQGFDSEWLAERILKNEAKFWQKWTIFQIQQWMIRDDWKKVMRLMEEDRRQLSTSPMSPPTPPPS